MSRTPPTRPATPWVRLGIAGSLVVLCALAGVAGRCDDMPGTPFVALVLVLAIQGATALGSFASSALAITKRDWPRVRAEAVAGLGMLLAIPVAAFALLSLSPSCAC